MPPLGPNLQDAVTQNQSFAAQNIVNAREGAADRSLQAAMEASRQSLQLEQAKMAQKAATERLNAEMRIAEADRMQETKLREKEIQKNAEFNHKQLQLRQHEIDSNNRVNQFAEQKLMKLDEAKAIAEQRILDSTDAAELRAAQEELRDIERQEAEIQAQIVSANTALERNKKGFDGDLRDLATGIQSEVVSQLEQQKQLNTEYSTVFTSIDPRENPLEDMYHLGGEALQAGTYNVQFSGPDVANRINSDPKFRSRAAAFGFLIDRTEQMAKIADWGEGKKTAFLNGAALLLFGGDPQANTRLRLADVKKEIGAQFSDSETAALATVLQTVGTAMENTDTTDTSLAPRAAIWPFGLLDRDDRGVYKETGTILSKSGILFPNANMQDGEFVPSSIGTLDAYIKQLETEQAPERITRFFERAIEGRDVNVSELHDMAMYRAMSPQGRQKFDTEMEGLLTTLRMEDGLIQSRADLRKLESAQLRLKEDLAKAKSILDRETTEFADARQRITAQTALEFLEELNRTFEDTVRRSDEHLSNQESLSTAADKAVSEDKPAPVPAPSRLPTSTNLKDVPKPDPTKPLKKSHDVLTQNPDGTPLNADTSSQFALFQALMGSPDISEEDKRKLQHAADRYQFSRDGSDANRAGEEIRELYRKYRGKK